MIRIDFTDDDLQSCKHKGEETVRICRGQGAKPRLKEGTESIKREQGNEMGFRGELAFAKLYNLPPTDVTGDADDGIDYVMPDGRTVDVKLSTYKNGNLIFDSFDKFKSDIAVLVYGAYNDTYVDVAGWISKEDFMTECYERKFGYGTRKVVDKKALRPMEELHEY